VNRVSTERDVSIGSFACEVSVDRNRYRERSGVSSAMSFFRDILVSRTINYEISRKKTKAAFWVPSHQGKGSPMVIALRDLSKTYRTAEIETTALDHIPFAVTEGEFLALRGPSGCGKSMLLHVLGLVDTATSGSYKFMGMDLSTFSMSEHVEMSEQVIANSASIRHWTE
jgi:ABC-type glutathione transport system ATPase component